MTLSELIRYVESLDEMILEVNYVEMVAKLSNGEEVRLVYPSQVQ